MALKYKNDKFLVMPLKNILSIMGLVNQPGTQKLWAIAHENVLKTQKLWAIAHENRLSYSL
jgi:hypothetical protein